MNDFSRLCWFFITLYNIWNLLNSKQELKKMSYMQKNQQG